jgi:SAM-dependent methyltransferase
MQTCPLCEQASSSLVEDGRRTYYHCLRCDLVFADRLGRLDQAAEKARYDKHENHPADPRYRRFLNRLAQPLLGRLQPAQCGLDYGCGPAPTLSLMLQEAGMVMAVYDPYYAPERRVLETRYDFVTCTEVVEHFWSPAEEWARLEALVKPGGWLAIMTRMVPDPMKFLQWRYKDDPTHVSFYSAATMDWLAARFGFAADQREGGVVLFQKPAVNLKLDAQRAVDSSRVAERRFVTKS